jgi:hypothetical protein
MAKSLHDDVLDGLCNIIKNNANRMTLCSQQPATYAEATSTYRLVEQAMVSGDFTISNGDTNGRKVRTAAKSGITPSASGTANHVALVDTGNSKLLAVTTCPSKTFDTSDLVDIAAWDIEVADPT